MLQAGGATLAEYEAGKKVVAQSGCLACHKIGENGNAGPGPHLTHIGSRLPRQGIARTLVNPTAPMPSFKNLPPKKFNAIVDFLSQLEVASLMPAQQGAGAAPDRAATAARRDASQPRATGPSGRRRVAWRRRRCARCSTASPASTTC